MEHRPLKTYPDVWITGLFADVDTRSGNKSYQVDGLTKGEWFAVLAMQSICQDRTAIYTVESIAEGAVKYADALIEALNKR